MNRWIAALVFRWAPWKSRDRQALRKMAQVIAEAPIRIHRQGQA